MSKDHQHHKKLELFECPMTGKKLAHKSGDSVVYSPDYETFMMYLSNNTYMEVAVDAAEKKKMKKADIKNIMERIKYTWKEEVLSGSFIKKKEKKDLLNKIELLHVVRYEL